MKSPSTVCLVILASALISGAIGCSRQNKQASNTSSPNATSPESQPPPAQNPPAAEKSATAQNPENPAPAAAPTAQTQAGPPPTAQAPVASQPTAPPAETEVAKAPEPPPPPPPKPKTFHVPAGSSISARTITAMSTKTVKTGDPFQASLSAPLIVHGVVIAPKGADVAGIVVNSDPGGRVKGVASLSLQIQSITSADGQTMRVHSNSVVQQAKSATKRNLTRTGIAAGAGAAIGAIAGGGKGAAIGAGVGGGAGLATNMATRGYAAELPAESVLHFTLADPIAITEVHHGSLAKAASTSP